jgi:hypothetical protein
MRRNPLEGMTVEGSVAPSRAAEEHRPLVNRNAVALYTKALEGVPFNLHLLVVGLPAGTTAPGNSDPLFVATRRQAQAIANKTLANVAFTFVPERGEDAPPRAPRGSAFRASPYTPFTVLHRMVDSVIGGEGPSWRELVPDHLRRALPVDRLYRLAELYDMQSRRLGYELARRGVSADRPQIDSAIMSAGVDTSAGRMGVVGNSAQVLADLFALRAKTGRWGFEPEAPLIVNGIPVAWPEFLLRIRRDYDKAMRAYVDGALIELSRNHFVFYI